MADKTEIIKIMSILKTAYPNFYNDDSDKEAVVNLWHMMFKDVAYEALTAAVKMYISEGRFVPTIADINSKLAGLKKIGRNELEADEAWGEVVAAMRYYGSYNETGALESMSELTRKVIKSMGFRSLCLSENIVADRAHFLKMYQIAQERKKQDDILPESVKQLVGIVLKGLESK